MLPYMLLTIRFNCCSTYLLVIVPTGSCSVLRDPEREVGAIPLSSAGRRLGGPRPEMQGLWDRSNGRALVSRKGP